MHNCTDFDTTCPDCHEAEFDAHDAAAKPRTLYPCDRTALLALALSDRPLTAARVHFLTTGRGKRYHDKAISESLESLVDLGFAVRTSNPALYLYELTSFGRLAVEACA